MSDGEAGSTPAVAIMKTVHKIQIYPGTGTQIVPGKPIAFQPQDGIPSCWYEIGDWYEVRVVATGEPVEDAFQYVDTLQIDWLVFHLYMRKRGGPPTEA